MIASVGFNRTYKIESNKSHISLCGDLVIELPHRSAAEIAGILVLIGIIGDLTVDLFEI